MQSFTSIIDALGYIELAQALGVPSGTVSSWKTRNSVPVRHWQTIVSMADARGIEGVSFQGMVAIASVRPTSREVAA